ncbi:ribulose phosphate epimerase [Enterovibrio norvegicus FF-33]|uniref:Ribulose phosphate epimerase n=1 Tax=Enterovibrio norvegicus FF-454 TaxID=1185651 RepID=A0A1E5CBN8_9GAMM|nr:GFA family protein [Enterovibrio norvegicus]OEE62875.1 ribulose phosphate epimerase [Enterovibrio norvegicus FF-454]OEE66799.1 ribulose phosphate epimerase [Enterovibrio norvegicus FF-33]OEE76564.1 ribulose phosphate epimerase [Enterovibrio norvegicus FF-162]
MPTVTSPYTGQCLCGQIRYEVDHIEPNMGHCHCSMCRKFHGAAFATFGEVKAESFRFVAGRDLLKAYVADNGTKRTFCSHCGSSLLFEPANSDGSLVEFTLGTLDSEIPIKPDAHIFTKYGAQWHDITDDLPTFSEGRELDSSQ